MVKKLAIHISISEYLTLKRILHSIEDGLAQKKKTTLQIEIAKVSKTWGNILNFLWNWICENPKLVQVSRNVAEESQRTLILSLKWRQEYPSVHY